jgi:hypothetical protein
VAVFINGFNIGFAITVNPSTRHGLRHHHTYLQGREHKNYRHRIIRSMSKYTGGDHTGYIFHQFLDQGAKARDPLYGDVNLRLRFQLTETIPIVLSIFFTTKGMASCQLCVQAERRIQDILRSRRVRTAHNFACSSCGLSSSGGLPFIEPPSARILSISCRSPLMSDPPPDGMAENRSWRTEKVDWELPPGPRLPMVDFILALSSSAFRSVTDAWL